MVVMDWRLKVIVENESRKEEKKIKWLKLREAETEFKVKVL